jgi:dTDP-4-dehydrorhamnose reductase
MKVLITGTSGLLGKALIATAPQNYELILAYHNNKPTTAKCSNKHKLVHFDLSKKPDFGNLSPDVIIHCAAIGSVDTVQKDYAYGIKLNFYSTLHMMEEAKRSKSKLVYISTNAVFDGRKPLYSEEDFLKPVNYYGLFKASSEMAIRSSDLDWIIIRPILMYGWPDPGERDNWVTTWIKKLSKNEECRVVNDVTTQPLYNIDCAIAVWKAIVARSRQIYNIAGDDRLTLYQFACKVAKCLQVPAETIKPASSTDFPGLAPRPKDTSYNLTKMHRDLNYRTLGVTEGINQMMRDKWLIGQHPA